MLLLYVCGGLVGAMCSITMRDLRFYGLGASSGVYALEAFNAMLHPHRTYVWCGMPVTAVQLLVTRLVIDVTSTFGGFCIDWAAHIGGSLAGVGFFEWLRRNAWLGIALAWDGSGSTHGYGWRVY
jgi:membrane associated rhomboid family serine protease|eukprot:SAG25_NODE_33_length_20262_cov_33.203293_1_plen_125_part_00